MKFRWPLVLRSRYEAQKRWARDLERRLRESREGRDREVQEEHNRINDLIKRLADIRVQPPSCNRGRCFVAQVAIDENVARNFGPGDDKHLEIVAQQIGREVERTLKTLAFSDLMVLGR